MYSFLVLNDFLAAKVTAAKKKKKKHCKIANGNGFITEICRNI
jgi:hypothetical protein